MTALLPALERASLFGLAALVVALLAQWGLDGRVPASWRVWVWRVALLQTSLAGVLALVPLAPLRIAVLPPQSQVKVQGSQAGSGIQQSPLPSAESVTSPAPAQTPPDSSPAVTSSAEEVLARVEPPKPLPTRQRAQPLPLWTILAVTYALGFAVQIGILARSIGRVRRLLRSCVPVDNAETGAHLNQIAQKMGVTARPRVLRGEGAPPFLAGILRPTIVVPHSLLESNKGDLEAVLSHELAHLKRRDLAWNAVLWFVQSLLWFHPLAWVSRHFLGLETESACDEMVLSSIRVSPKSYGALLLNTMNTESTPFAAGIADGFATLKTRLKRLNHAPKNPRRIAKFTFSTALCLAFVPLVPLHLVAWAQTGASFPSAMGILGGKQEVLCVAFSPDGKLLAEGDAQGGIRIYDVWNRRLQRTLRGQSRQIFSLAWSPDGGTLVNNFGELWDTKTWHIREKLAFTTPKAKGPSTHFNVAVAWSPDGQSLASGGSYRTLFRREAGPNGTRGWKVVRREPGDWINSVAFSPDGRLLAEGGNNHFSLWNARQLRPQGGWTSSPLLTGSNHSLLALRNRYKRVAASPNPPREELFKLRVLIERYLTATHGTAEKVAFSPDGRLLAVARSGSARAGGHRLVIDAPNGQQVTLNSSATRGGKIAVWNLRTGALQHLLTVPGNFPSALSFSPNGRILAAAGGQGDSLGRKTQRHEIKLWNVQTGELVQALNDHTGQITSLSWSPNGATLASGSQDKTVRLWPVLVPVSQGVRPLLPSNATPQEVLTSFYTAINQQDLNAAAGLLWERPIGGVDFSGLRQVLSDAKANDLVLRTGAMRIEHFGDEAAARFKVLVSRRVPQTKLNRLVLGEVRAELRRGEQGWQLREEPFPAAVGRAEILGRVLDEAGRPLAGIGITASLLSQRSNLPARADIRALQVSSPLKSRLIARLSATLDVTRADGSFRLSGLTNGTYAVGVDRSVNVSGSSSSLGAPAGYFAPPSLRVVASEATRVGGLNVVLQRGVTVQGRIVDATTQVPLRGVEISAFVKPPSSPPDNFEMWSVMNKTDKQGRYTITLPPRTIGLSIQSQRAKQNIVVQAGGATYSAGRDVKAVVNGANRSFNSVLWLPQGSKGQTFNVELKLQRVQVLRQTEESTPLSGSGIALQLQDKPRVGQNTAPVSGSRGVSGLVHDFDILAAVNELRAANARGIAVNGVRLTGNTSIRATGSLIYVGRQAIKHPYRIEAIGDPKAMQRALTLRGGWVNQLKEDLTIRVSRVAQLRLPAAATSSF
jgi:WD40 repeat protein/beta-lactamase regulating signal transducer with metallopeptidase domain/uncharacterized protein YlxW (UPF0749 family)